MKKSEAQELIYDFTKLSGLDRVLKSTPLTLSKIISNYLNDPKREVKFDEDKPKQMEREQDNGDNMDRFDYLRSY